MERGYYGYIDKEKNIRTLYSLEYTFDQKVIDTMESSAWDPGMLTTRKFNYLEDALTNWNSLYYNEKCLYVMLYEQIILDGEVILEQCKDMSVPTVLDNISKQKVKEAEDLMEIYKEENEKMKNFLLKYGIDVKKVEV